MSKIDKKSIEHILKNNSKTFGIKISQMEEEDYLIMKSLLSKINLELNLLGIESIKDENSFITKGVTSKTLIIRDNILNPSFLKFESIIKGIIKNNSYGNLISFRIIKKIFDFSITSETNPTDSFFIIEVIKEKFNDLENLSLLKKEKGLRLVSLLESNKELLREQEKGIYGHFLTGISDTGLIKTNQLFSKGSEDSQHLFVNIIQDKNNKENGFKEIIKYQLKRICKNNKLISFDFNDLFLETKDQPIGDIFNSKSLLLKGLESEKDIDNNELTKKLFVEKNKWIKRENLNIFITSIKEEILKRKDLIENNKPNKFIELFSLQKGIDSLTKFPLLMVDFGNLGELERINKGTINKIIELMELGKGTGILFFLNNTFEDIEYFKKIQKTDLCDIIIGGKTNFNLNKDIYKDTLFRKGSLENLFGNTEYRMFERDEYDHENNYKNFIEYKIQGVYLSDIQKEKKSGKIFKKDLLIKDNKLNNKELNYSEIKKGTAEELMYGIVKSKTNIINKLEDYRNSLDYKEKKKIFINNSFENLEDNEEKISVIKNFTFSLLENSLILGDSLSKRTQQLIDSGIYNILNESNPFTTQVIKFNYKKESIYQNSVFFKTFSSISQEELNKEDIKGLTKEERIEIFIKKLEKEYKRRMDILNKYGFNNYKELVTKCGEQILAKESSSYISIIIESFIDLFGKDINSSYYKRIKELIKLSRIVGIGFSINIEVFNKGIINDLRETTQISTLYGIKGNGYNGNLLGFDINFLEEGQIAMIGEVLKKGKIIDLKDFKNEKFNKNNLKSSIKELNNSYQSFI